MFGNITDYFPNKDHKNLIQIVELGKHPGLTDFHKNPEE